MPLCLCGQINLCKDEIILSSLSFRLFAFIFSFFSRFCHFGIYGYLLTVVNDKFAKINSRFLIVEGEAIGVEAEVIEK